MEITDLVYLILLDKFSRISWPVSLKIGHVYRYKSVDIAYADWILLYNTGSSMDWFGIGASNYLVIDRTSIDVRTASRDRYSKLKDLIKQAFTGDVFVFNGSSVVSQTLVQDTDWDRSENIGFYVDRYHLNSSSNYQFNRGDKIEITDNNGNSEYVWVWGVYDDWLYVIKKSGIYCLIRPVGVTELSDKLKGLYRFVFDVQGDLIENVSSI